MVIEQVYFLNIKILSNIFKAKEETLSLIEKLNEIQNKYDEEMNEIEKMKNELVLLESYLSIIPSYSYFFFLV